MLSISLEGDDDVYVNGIDLSQFGKLWDSARRHGDVVHALGSDTTLLLHPDKIISVIEVDDEPGPEVTNLEHNLAVDAERGPPVFHGSELATPEQARSYGRSEAVIAVMDWLEKRSGAAAADTVGQAWRRGELQYAGEKIKPTYTRDQVLVLLESAWDSSAVRPENARALAHRQLDTYDQASVSS